MKRQAPIPPNEKKLRRKLSEVTEQVHLFLEKLDRYMAEPSTAERGRKIAALCNALEVYNDGIRYFWCGVNYRTDTPASPPRRTGEGTPLVEDYAVDPVDGAKAQRSTRDRNSYSSDSWRG